MNEHTYSISRNPKLPDLEAFEPYVAGPPNAGPFYLGNRTEDDRVELALFGTFSTHRIEELKMLLAGAKSCAIRTFDMHGGSCEIAAELCRCLDAIGRSSVSCHVSGRLSSCGCDVLFFSGHTSCDRTARFEIHGPRLNIYRRHESTLNTLLDGLDAEYEAARAVLQKRLANPEIFLDGRNHEFDSATAVLYNLIDEITT